MINIWFPISSYLLSPIVYLLPPIFYSYLISSKVNCANDLIWTHKEITTYTTIYGIAQVIYSQYSVRQSVRSETWTTQHFFRIFPLCGVLCLYIRTGLEDTNKYKIPHATSPNQDTSKGTRGDSETRWITSLKQDNEKLGHIQYS